MILYIDVVVGEGLSAHMDWKNTGSSDLKLYLSKF
jgi:hypothetical protein